MDDPLPRAKIALCVNGRPHWFEVEPRELLAELVRDRLSLRGCHIGCETTSCGSCTVLLDGESVKACTVLAVQADGGQVMTIEGLADGGLHPVQEEFTRQHALQCGFCTPGMVLAAVSLIAEGRAGDEASVRRALKGNLCRCTGYQNIVDAVLAAAGGPAMRPFAYHRAESAEHAVALLATRDGAVLLAGGQSLLPSMKQGAAAPPALVDINMVAALRYIELGAGTLRLGAAARQAQIELSPAVRRAVPLLAHAAGHVGDPQVRHRGTIGGVLGQGDSTADLSAALIALHATVTVLGPRGGREIPVDALWTRDGQLRRAEMVTEVSVPVPPRGAGWAFRSLRHRQLDPAVVAVAVQRGTRPGIGLAGMGRRPLRAGPAERALARGAPASQVVADARAGADPPSNSSGSAAYRLHLAGVLLAEALRASASGLG